MTDGSERVGTRFANKWTLESVLGSGGMATVYRARHDIGRVHALKLLHPEVARVPEVVARFEQEARAVNRFHHPGAIEVHDFDVAEDGTPYLVMELCEGETIAERAERDAVPVEEVLRITEALLDVLAAAHDARIIHRDIKPDNVLLTKEGIKVLDFGIARIKDAAAKTALTRADERIGTVYYMSPEQIHGLPVDGRADVFAVGATMFWLLAGDTIHDADSLVDLILKMGKLPAPHIATVAPELAPDVCAVVDRALAFNRAHRYPDARTMKRDVIALREGHAPPHATERLRSGDDPSSRGIGPVVEMAGLSVEATMPALALAQSSPELERIGAAEVEAGLLGETIAGTYELVALLGRGGMGAVYEARSDEGARYAVKVIVNEYQNNPEARRRFRREAAAVSRVNSPHVVGAVEVGEDPDSGLPFIAMEYLDGFDLEHLISERGALAMPVVATLGVQACRGLGAAHATNIIHRDVKPANLFVDTTADGAHAPATLRVCDFGLAKQRLGDDARRSKLTATGSMLGTPLYACPEQLTDAKSVDHRADVWGLCLALYEALSGEAPWRECTTQGQLVVAICTQDIERLSIRAPWVDPALAEVIHRGLERAPGDRWQSMKELEDALLPFATDRAQLTWGELRSADTTVQPRSAAASVATPHDSGRVPSSQTQVLPAESLMSVPPPRARRGVWVAAAAVLLGGGIVAFGLGDGATSKIEAAPARTAITRSARPVVAPRPTTSQAHASPAPSTPPSAPSPAPHARVAPPTPQPGPTSRPTTKTAGTTAPKPTASPGDVIGPPEDDGF